MKLINIDKSSLLITIKCENLHCGYITNRYCESNHAKTADKIDCPKCEEVVGRGKSILIRPQRARKLTEYQVIEIKELLKSTDRTLRQIAVDYGVHYSTIRNIRIGVCYGELNELIKAKEYKVVVKGYIPSIKFSLCKSISYETKAK